MADQNDHFNKLKIELERLGSHTLPNPTRRAIQDARSHLDSLTQQMAQDEEHRQLAALFRVLQSLGTSLNLDEVLNQAMDAVIALTGAERGFLMLTDPETGKLNVMAARNFEQKTLEEASMEVSRTVINTVLDSGEGVVTTNAQDDPAFKDQKSIVMYVLRSILCAPLMARGRMIGVIYVDNRIHTSIFSKSDLELLNALAVQAAIAIENATLYTQTDQDLAERINDLETITHINRELNDSLDLEYILEATQRWALTGTQADEAWIALNSPDNPAFTIAVGPRKSERLDPAPPLIAHAVSDSTSDLVLAQKSGIYQMAASIVIFDDPIGVIFAESNRPFTEPAQAFLPRLAARAASAIQNARLFQAVQQANYAKSKFVSVVSHELRLPMTSIKGYTDLILAGIAGDVSDQQKEFLGVIRNNVGRMTTLVADLSDISRIETGRLNIEIKPTHIRPIVESVSSTFQIRFQEQNQTSVVMIPADLPAVLADENRLTQVVTNLVGNAVKYTPEGGRIEITAEPVDGQVRFAVIDDGIGISPEDQTKLFSQFFRSEDDFVRERQGWGLGLNVTKNLVELMSGEIGFDSELGKGSTFWVLLPLAAD